MVIKFFSDFNISLMIDTLLWIFSLGGIYSLIIFDIIEKEDEKFLKV